MRLLDDILFFFFPDCCDVCGRILGYGEEVICLHCYLGIPRTNFHTDPENPVVKVFWGRVKVDMASSFFYFRKGSDYQKLLHKLKYKGRGDIGIYLGKIYGSEIRESEISRADLIIPVPLHKKKEKRRGYNQSSKISEGLATMLDIPLDDRVLRRIYNTESQTRRNRFERFLNMQDKFMLTDPEHVRGKKILLVDDVVTTGATLEACAHVLNEAGCAGVFVLTLAVA